MPRDASSALEMREFEGVLKASLSHTSRDASGTGYAAYRWAIPCREPT
jgi:hypothetical protein